MNILHVHAHTSYTGCAHPILTPESEPRYPARSLPTQQPGSLPLLRSPKPLNSVVAEAPVQCFGACPACMRLGFIPVPCKSKAPTKQHLSKGNLYSRCQQPQAAAWPESDVCSPLVCPNWIPPALFTTRVLLTKAIMWIRVCLVVVMASTCQELHMHTY